MVGGFSGDAGDDDRESGGADAAGEPVAVGGLVALSLPLTADRTHPVPAVLATKMGFIEALNHFSPLIVLREPPSRADRAALVVRIRFEVLLTPPPSLRRLLRLSLCFCSSAS